MSTDLETCLDIDTIPEWAGHTSVGAARRTPVPSRVYRDLLNFHKGFLLSMVWLRLEPATRGALLTSRSLLRRPDLQQK